MCSTEKGLLKEQILKERKGCRTKTFHREQYRDKSNRHLEKVNSKTFVTDDR